MDRLFNKKSKKSLKSSRRHLSLGVPTNTAVGPVGFRAELDIGPKGEQVLSYRKLEVDRSDSSTVITDEGEVRTSRIVFHNRKSEDQGFTVAETSATGAVVGRVDHGNGHTGEYC